MSILPAAASTDLRVGETGLRRAASAGNVVRYAENSHSHIPPQVRPAEDVQVAVGLALHGLVAEVGQ